MIFCLFLPGLSQLRSRRNWIRICSSPGRKIHILTIYDVPFFIFGGEVWTAVKPLYVPGWRAFLFQKSRFSKCRRCTDCQIIAFCKFFENGAHRSTVLSGGSFVLSLASHLGSTRHIHSSNPSPQSINMDRASASLQKTWFQVVVILCSFSPWPIRSSQVAPALRRSVKCSS